MSTCCTMSCKLSQAVLCQCTAPRQIPITLIIEFSKSVISTCLWQLEDLSSWRSSVHVHRLIAQQLSYNA